MTNVVKKNILKLDFNPRNLILAKKVKVNGIYQVYDKDLKINKVNNGDSHDIVVCSINKKNKTARIKTITSLEYKRNNNYLFKNYKLDYVKNGSILPIPKSFLKSKFFSGIDHRIKIVSLSKIFYKNSNDKTIFPKRYKNLIHRK